jgi:YesN/AraC family two-component response regulator
MDSAGLYEKHRDALYQAVKYINDNCCTNITINDAAKVAILSQSYFSYLFKQLTNKTFTEYVNGLRIAKAVELLKNNPDMKILEICFEVGYNNVNHFNRMFKQEMGTTPMKLRRK